MSPAQSYRSELDSRREEMSRPSLPQVGSVWGVPGDPDWQVEIAKVFQVEGRDVWHVRYRFCDGNPGGIPGCTCDLEGFLDDMVLIRTATEEMQRRTLAYIQRNAEPKHPHLGFWARLWRMAWG